jgi:Domain of unknown function (DUF4382)
MGPRNAALLFSLSLLFAACGSSNDYDALFEVGMGASAASDSTPNGATTGDGGAIAPRPVRLEVTVLRVDVHVASRDDANDDGPFDDKIVRAVGGDKRSGGEEDGSWVTVFTGPQRLDLLEDGVTEAFLAAAWVPAGRVTQIRLVLADDVVLIEGPTRIAIKCPSCSESGLKIVTAGRLELPARGRVHIKLELDAERSLVLLGGAKHLAPVIKIVVKDG